VRKVVDFLYVKMDL